jgi:hypothetical protein
MGVTCPHCEATNTIPLSAPPAPPESPPEPARTLDPNPDSARLIDMEQGPLPPANTDAPSPAFSESVKAFLRGEL